MKLSGPGDATILRYNRIVRLLITADLHYDIRRSREPARHLARTVCRTAADALVLVGDTAGADLDRFAECLELFGDFNGRKFLVPGNHELWCVDGQGSLERYETLLPDVADRAGFAVLDHAPADLDGLGLVGSVGWYDYSLRDTELGIPLPFYRNKISPGAARYYGLHGELLERHAEDLTDRHLALGARWMDGWRVRLGMSDEAFLDRLLETLRQQLDDLVRRTDRILAFVHHLPFADMLPRNRPDRFAFAAAYMGADRIGQLLQEYPSVTDVYCGHSHWPGEYTIGHLRVVNVGSTYVEKQLHVLDT
jgi:predicted phosphohydrolase